jgi:hypothetical protein
MRLSWKPWPAAALRHADTAFALSPVSPPRRPPQVWIDPAQPAEPVRLQDVAIDIRIRARSS